MYFSRLLRIYPILLISTEGYMDPERYAKTIMAGGLRDCLSQKITRPLLIRKIVYIIRGLLCLQAIPPERSLVLWIPRFPGPSASEEGLPEEKPRVRQLQ